MNTQLKIALIGYGAMGKEIERIAIEKGIVVTDIFDIDSKIDPNKKYEFDVAIDFTQPDSIKHNLLACANLKKNIVIGTTGWYDKKDEFKSIVQESDIACVWGSNFSVGMQMFFRIVSSAASIVEKADDYDIMIHELHHKRKKDSPSGSAISIANIILDKVSRKKGILDDTARELIDEELIHLSSTRGGEITGIHTVYLDSYADVLELTHRAKNRTGFAVGSLLAAQWILGKKGFHDFSDVLNEIWSRK